MEIQNRTTIVMNHSEKEMTIYYESDGKGYQISLAIQIPPLSRISLLSTNQLSCLYLDQNQQLLRFSIKINHQNHLYLDKCVIRPYLQWQQIKDKCQPIGEKGYFADCFLYPQQNLVIKKFRSVHHAFKSTRQVQRIKKVQEIQPNIYHHDLIYQGVVIGFSMTYYKGQNWFKLTAHPDHLLNRSPVARVQLVIKLADFMRKLQSIGFCHGDLHLENVLIDIEDTENLLYPKLSVKVIDFGNGFEMFEGETVSEGLTGFSPIVPPEVEFCHKKDYNPWGLNAYQLGRNALQILLQNMHRNLCLLDYTPLKQLHLLRQRRQYPSDLHSIVKQLVHYSIQKRNTALFQNICHLQEATRQIFRSQHSCQ